MVPRLVPEILSHDAFCDTGAGGAAAAGIGDSRSWIEEYMIYMKYILQLEYALPFSLVLTHSFQKLEYNINCENRDFDFGNEYFDSDCGQT